MKNEKGSTKIDVSSKTIEKGLDIAKSFAEKLVSPPIEELGLLIKDQISYWRFSNQVKILNKAKSICDQNKISVKAISPKLLCPYLENASLEDDEELQDKWATLLANMVDSQQNVQNHVFPHILSQLSKAEFRIIESAYLEKTKRVSKLRSEILEFTNERPRIENDLKSKLRKLTTEREALPKDQKSFFKSKVFDLHSSIWVTERQIKNLENQVPRLKRKIAAPQPLPEENIKAFELANIIRLGLAKDIYEATAETQSIDIPDINPDFTTSVDIDLEIDTEKTTIITELGELFIEACSNKKA